MKAMLVVTLVLMSEFALACRCAQQTLAQYYDNADEVFIGTLKQTQPLDEQQVQFRFERIGPAYKQASEDTVRLPYISYRSSAACAVAAQPGAVYVVFAQRNENSGFARINSCNGTRIHRSIEGARSGFEDVPENHVVSQLTALAGLDALRRISAVEPVVNDVNSTRVVGMLDVAGFSHTDELPVFARPGRLDSVQGVITGYGDVQHRESGYEVDAALVYAVVDGWYRIQLQNQQFAWLAPDAAGTFWPLDELLVNRLTYFVSDWNRLVWPGIGAGIPQWLSYTGEQPPREQAVKIISSQRIAHSLWFEVEVLQHNECEGKPEKVMARGWVPAYTEAGEPAAWFYSRGC
ncbi:MAG: hypothetical protein ACFHXK_11330 [bacterium]